jgi:hypothetical protein
MQADGDDHGDALVGDAAGVQLIEQRRDEDAVGARARQIGDGDDGGRARPRGDRFAAGRSGMGVAVPEWTTSTSNQGWSMNSSSSCPYGTRWMRSSLGARCTARL